MNRHSSDFKCKVFVESSVSLAAQPSFFPLRSISDSLLSRSDFHHGSS